MSARADGASDHPSAGWLQLTPLSDARNRSRSGREPLERLGQPAELGGVLGLHGAQYRAPVPLLEHARST